MPDAQFHIKKARRNEDFYISHKLETSGFNDWAIVVLFYILMHYVDAVLRQDISLSNDLRDPSNHPDRKMAIAKCSELDQIANNYLVLYDRSREARYYYHNFPDDYFNNLVSLVFKPAQEYLKKFLNLS
jgi:hypothetical protein